MRIHWHRRDLRLADNRGLAGDGVRPPEARWGDPESDLVSAPSVDIPGEDDESAGVEIDADLARLFWVTVVYANVALAGIGIGLLLVAFRGQWGLGGGAAAVGLFALYRTYDLYRTYQEDFAGADEEAGDGERND